LDLLATSESKVAKTEGRKQEEVKRLQKVQGQMEEKLRAIQQAEVKKGQINDRIEPK
jgi:hypothetical protein